MGKAQKKSIVTTERGMRFSGNESSLNIEIGFDARRQSVPPPGSARVI